MKAKRTTKQATKMKKTTRSVKKARSKPPLMAREEPASLECVHDPEAVRQGEKRLSRPDTELEQAVAERTAELSTCIRQMEEFIYTVAHDLRAPLRAMQGFSAMLLEETSPSLSERARDFATRINNSAKFMDSLLRDLLAFSRINQQSLEFRSVNLESVVHSALAQLEKEIEEKHARIEMTPPWFAVRAHEKTLQSVLQNLISNALKFVDHGVSPHVRIYAKETGQDIRVWIQDNGIGIDPEFHERIFRVFTRIHGEEYPGTGIGLAIVQKGVERMGGRVGVESTPGQGSRFWIELLKA